MTRHHDRVLAIQDIIPDSRNARTHSKKQIRQIAESIKAFGYAAPIIVDEGNVVIAGHGRLAAMKHLGLKEVSVVVIEGLTPARKRALALADNKIAENAGWDRQMLAIEIPELRESLELEGLSIDLAGFSVPELDALAVDFEENAAEPADTIDPDWEHATPVSQRGSLWLLGGHRLLCGDARLEADLDALMDGEQAAAAFLDPPYNVRVAGIGGRGKTKHAEFAMASGEMSDDEFGIFLIAALGNARRVSRDGAVHYVCMDWRHVSDLIAAGRVVYDDVLNIVVWVKSNAGMGSFYRSQHEFIVVFRAGEGPHLNNIELGRHGRSRSNVWRYAGVNTFRAGRMEELRSHATPKPVAMVADALKDCTRRNDIVLDTFSGSGSTILAAERVGRRCRAMEFEPRFVDVAVRRWQAFTGKDALEAVSGRTFDEIAKETAPERPPASKLCVKPRAKGARR